MEDDKLFNQGPENSGSSSVLDSCTLARIAAFPPINVKILLLIAVSYIYRKSGGVTNGVACLF